MGGGSPITTAGYMLAVFNFGLTVADLNHMTIGMVLDLMEEASDRPEAIRATQSDYDSF